MQSGKVNERDKKGRIKMDKDLRDILKSNWVWFLTVVLGAGGLIWTVGNHSTTLASQSSVMDKVSDRVTKCEQVEIGLNATDEKIGVKLDVIESGIREIKASIKDLNDRNVMEHKEIKSILYKPAIGNLNEVSVSNLVSLK